MVNGEIVKLTFDGRSGNLTLQNVYSNARVTIPPGTSVLGSTPETASIFEGEEPSSVVIEISLDRSGDIVINPGDEAVSITGFRLALEPLKPGELDPSLSMNKMQAAYKAQQTAHGLAVGENDLVVLGTISRAVARKIDAGRRFKGPLFEDGTNQDASLVLDTPEGTVLAVFDGLGGHVSSGREASGVARQALANAVAAKEGPLFDRAFLTSAMEHMTSTLTRYRGHYSDTDTTAAVVIVSPPDARGRRKVLSSGLGDSLAFAVSDELGVVQLNQDQSLQMSVFDKTGEVTRRGGSGSTLWSTVAMPSELEIRSTTIEPNDVVILTTDGITGDSPDQDPLGGVGVLLNEIACGRQSLPDSMVKDAIGRSKKTDDRTVFVFAAEGVSRWGNREFPQFNEAVAFEAEHGGLDEWVDKQTPAPSGQNHGWE